MAEGPEIHKSISPGGPPSELPDEPLEYPGKPLSHRFSPLEGPRKKEEPKETDVPKIATDAPFKPIASISYPDKNVHFAPVTNIRPRGLQPVALSGSVSLPTGGVGVFELSPDLRRSLEARLSNTVVPTPPPPTEARPTRSAPSESLNRSVEAVHTELERLKEIAKAELEKRRAFSKNVSEAPAEVRGLVLPKVPESSRPSQPLGVMPDLDSQTKKLLSEAAKLEEELAALKAGVTIPAAAPPSEPVVPPPAPTAEDPHLKQIRELFADKNSLLAKVDELSANYRETLEERNVLEEKLANLTKNFERQIQEIKIEKDNLLGQIKEFKEKAGPAAEEAAGEKYLVELNQLKAQLSSVEKDRDETRERLRKMEILVTELGHKREETRRIVTPSAEEPKEERAGTARIIKPQVAVGKMAPALTTAPNVINGIVRDASGLLLSNVIIVVKDEKGDPVRALKTNKIGQFAISTPLPNGTYNMELEAPGKSFDIIQVEVEGRVLPPIEIKASN